MEKQIEQLAKQLPDSLVVIVDGLIQYIAGGFFSHLNFSNDDWIGKPLTELATENQKEVLERVQWECENLTVTDSSEYRTIDFLGYFDDNGEVWVEFRGKMGVWQDTPAIIGILTDITARKRRENKLRHNHKNQQALITYMPALVYRCGCDHNQSMEYLSLETDQLTGYSFEELMVDNLISFEDLIIPSDRQLVFESINSVAESGQSFEIDYRITAKNGEVKYVQEIGRSIQDESGEFAGFIGMIFDVSEKRQTEEKLLQSERMVAMGEMASGVAHDFNNVLTGILGRAQLLQFMDIPENFLNDIQTIEKIAHDGAEIVRRIQVFTRSRNASNLTPVDMNSVIRDVVDLMKPRWHDQAKSNNIHINMLTELNPIPRIKGNETELREALTNLINNAIDAIRDQGSIWIISEQSGDNIHIYVKDDGMGIPSGNQRKIFAPFYSTKGMDGSGLGLSVTRKIVERHNGEITVESESEKGTEFQLVFPMAKMLTNENKDTESPQSDIIPARILIIEMEQNVRTLMQDILERDGHEVHSFDNVLEALSSQKEIKPDIIISDISSTGTEGEELVRQIRNNQPGANIVLSSGLDDHVYQEKMRNSKVELMIKKPFDIKQLRSVIAQILKKSG